MHLQRLLLPEQEQVRAGLEPAQARAVEGVEAQGGHKKKSKSMEFRGPRDSVRRKI